MKAFITYVRPLLEYGTPVWSPHAIGNIDAVEAVQRRFTKSIHGLSSVWYIERLVELSLETLELRRLKQEIIMCFKIINVEIDPVNFFSLSFPPTALQGATSTSCSNSLCVLMPVNLALL